MSHARIATRSKWLGAPLLRVLIIAVSVALLGGAMVGHANASSQFARWSSDYQCEDRLALHDTDPSPEHWQAAEATVCNGTQSSLLVESIIYNSSGTPVYADLGQCSDCRYTHASLAFNLPTGGYAQHYHRFGDNGTVVIYNSWSTLD
jgi:hypothetical protein